MLKRLGQWEREHMPCLNCGRAVFAGGCCDAPDLRSRDELRKSLSESREREGVMRSVLEGFAKLTETPEARLIAAVCQKALAGDGPSLRSQVIEECARVAEAGAVRVYQSHGDSCGCSGCYAEGNERAAGVRIAARLRSLAKEKK